MHRAVRMNDASTVDVLLAAGGDPSACDWLDMTPVMLALHLETEDVLRVLLDHELRPSRTARRPTPAARGGARSRRVERPILVDPEEFKRREARANAVAEELLADEAVEEATRQRAAARRERRHAAAAARGRRPYAPRSPTPECDLSRAASPAELDEPTWLAELLWRVDDTPEARRAYVERSVADASALRLGRGVDHCVAVRGVHGRSAMHAIAPVHAHRSVQHVRCARAGRGEVPAMSQRGA
jgi:hypothetical protein